MACHMSPTEFVAQARALPVPALHGGLGFWVGLPRRAVAGGWVSSAMFVSEGMGTRAFAYPWSFMCNMAAWSPTYQQPQCDCI